MNIKRTPAFAGLAVLALLAAEGLVGPAHAMDSALPSGGTLFIEFGDVDRIRWDDDNTPGDLSDDEIVAVNNLRDLPGFNRARFDCELALDGTRGATSGLLDIVAPGGTPGFNEQKDQVGRRSNSRGVDCGRTVSGDSIELRLGSDVDFKAISTDLGFTVKKNVVVEIDAYADDVLIDTFELRSGNSVVDGEGNPPITDPPQDPSLWEVGSNIFNCNPFSDSGSDNDASCRLAGLNVVWDRLVLTAASIPDNGEFAIGDGTTEIKLAGVDGILDCGDRTVTAVNGATGAFGYLRRLVDNGFGGEECNVDCTAIPYSLSWLGDELLFLAEYGDQICAAFEFVVTFDPYDLVAPPAGAGEIARPQDDPATPPPAGAGDDERAVVVGDFSRTVTDNIPLSIVQQFVTDPPTPDPEFYLDTCLGLPNYADAADVAAGDAPGVGDLVALMPPAAGFPDMSNLPGTQYGCWHALLLKYGLDGQVQPDGTVLDVEAEDKVRLEVRGYLQGDYTLRRR